MPNNNHEFDQLDLWHDTYIFMKIGSAQDTRGNTYIGHEIMQFYLDDQATRGYTWFSTESLSNGMAESQVTAFQEAIHQGHKVGMIFVIGRDAGGTNDIAYTAEVLNVYSKPEPGYCPERNAFPTLWHKKARIWIKLTNLMLNRTLSVTDFVIKSTGNSLQTVINRSQFHFGYVQRVWRE
ncbi:hypothetical protein [Heliophilum fasciatum]|uniref:Uncharacterized protein n=1 Tax=Heliophilum fasciatum TaxID=35700 RepID=A0A4R2S027_9FIRM|nr:hypothetical protein [Heliophilum fasciatum]MCW2276780.1 hypothetical protein [Heliophilum fasciatum]TCP68759.1 hypothetical protein EDD73_102155 [Heliophilum fasciatum]